MRIKEFTIKNFKNIGHNEPCTVTFPRVDGEGASDFITIIGENNIGKSSLLEALKLFLPETDTSNTPTIDMFPFIISKMKLTILLFQQIKVSNNNLYSVDVGAWGVSQL
ncbi:MAG: AAA family ATPase [Anaerobacillus sp.]|uniref:AAA family ATPase n=1 Tax=Anaerobacillus sp. TaxID=1872506 RepID=UPI00391A52B3